ncbi:unnamed protein product, partial [Owenia fusiformis]
KMADPILMFLFAKSKFRQNIGYLGRYWLIFVLFIQIIVYIDAQQPCGSGLCYEGKCQNGTCICDPGWTGGDCTHCVGRVRLTAKSGFISDGYGNYSLDTKCTWLVDSGEANTKIHLQMLQFATECSWDHVYIYDGDSVFSSLRAVLSGLILKQNAANSSSLPAITLNTGKAYFHFYSDAAYNMSGFNISYTIAGCPKDCSGQGTCNISVCICDSKWMGDACDIPKCPKGCINGTCDTQKNMCVCEPGFRGIDCSTPDRKGVWMPEISTNTIGGRASHKSVIYGADIYVLSGDNFGNTPFENIVKYNIPTKTWETIEPLTEGPAQRYGHSLILHDGAIYLYGGLIYNTISNELWKYTINENTWELLNPKMNSSIPLYAVVGHTAHIIGDVMYVIFGHSPTYGYLNTVLEFNLKGNLTWKVAETTGAIVKGGYGHSSVYDSESKLIYIHGGYHSHSATKYVLADDLYAYDPAKRTWTFLRSSDRFRYLHSASIIDGVMLIYGGNTHNDTSASSGAKCYSNEFLAYNIKCGSWYSLEGPKLVDDISRFGHTSNVHEGAMYIFGGFNGLMENSMYKFLPGMCSKYTRKLTCLNAMEGKKCVYVEGIGCKDKSDVTTLLNDKVISTLDQAITHDEATCPTPEPDESQRHCNRYDTCPSCLLNPYECTWCDGKCTASKCDNPQMPMLQSVRSVDQCPAKDSSKCYTLHNCHACSSDSNCTWIGHEKICQYSGPEATQSNLKSISNPLKCPAACYTHGSCENCTKTGCMWCSNQRRCVESNSYVASFPYGQCMEWTTHPEKCPATRCTDLKTCSDCQNNPRCGWCDDGTNTGLGSCMEGGDTGPVWSNNTHVEEDRDKCPAPRWFFTECPVCQCNGHSTCIPGTDTCQACGNNTEGDQCQHCVDGYYGNPRYGGNCTECMCNDQADTCDRESGKCYCFTRGVIGDQCDRCDESNRYYGNPRGGGTCYYQLNTNYMFTFNLSKKEDKHVEVINFLNTPRLSDRDLDFTINCSGPALINVTYSSADTENHSLIYKTFKCRYFKMKFSHRDYEFGQAKNLTFYVYVYNFTTPFWLQIAFSQMPYLDLLTFFATFFSCFLSLLLIAAIIWKVKQRYDAFRRGRRMIVEMEQMASRPFASMAYEIEQYNEVGTLLGEKKENNPQPPPSRHRKKQTVAKPSPVALEPLNGHKAAVLTVLVRLPCGDEDHTPPGTTGIVMGSSLVTLGSRKASMDYTGKIVTKKSGSKDTKDSSSSSSSNKTNVQATGPTPDENCL